MELMTILTLGLLIAALGAAFTEHAGYWDSTFLSGKGDLDSRIRLPVKRDRRYIFDPFDLPPILSAVTYVTGLAVSTTSLRTVESAYGNAWDIDPLGTTQTKLCPLFTNNGWDISHDLTDDEKIEMVPGGGATFTNCPHSFVVGTDAAFFLRIKMLIADVSGSDQTTIGFRKQEAANGTHASYTDYAVIGSISGDIKTLTEVNAGGTSTVDSTQNWADAETHTVVVKVSSAGVVTFEIDAAAPTVTQSFTFDSGDRLTPYIWLIHDATTPGANTLREWESGLQPSSRVTLV